MSADLLKRLEDGIRAADANGDTEGVQKLGAEYRRIQNEMAGGNTPAQTQPEQTGFFDSLGNAFRANVDPILEGVGTTAEVFGAEGLGQGLKNLTEMPEGYVSSTDQFMNADEDGSFAWRHLPGAIGEQAGQFAGSIASRAIGAAGGGALGSMAGPGGAAAGATIGGFTGPAAFEAMQILGPVAMERAKNNGRSEPNMEDLMGAAATASASGALNALAPGAQGFVRRFLLEGATEGAQSLAQQTGETLATEKGFEVDLRQALGEGIIGMGSAAAVDSSIAGVKKAAATPKATIDGIRYDNREFTPDEVKAADRLLRASDNNMDTLGNVDHVNEGSGKGTANAALRQIRGEAGVIVNNLRKLARHRNDMDALASIETMAKTMSSQTTPTPEAFKDDLDFYFPNEPDVARLRSLHGEMNAIQGFTAGGTGDMGGLSKLTRLIDVTDDRNSLKLMGYASLAKGSAIASMGTGILANRVARRLDKLTNRRSKVKRFTESALRSGEAPTDVIGPNAADTLNALKDEEKAAKEALKKQAAEAKAKIAQEKAQALQQKKTDNLNQKAAEKAAIDQSKAESQAMQFKMHNAATEQMFAADKADEGISGHAPYVAWQDATGIGPDSTLEILEQLAREGLVPQDFPQRFREDIRSFPTDKNNPESQKTYLAQDLVRQRGNPGHKNADKVGKKKKRQKSPDEALNAYTNRIYGDRYKDKASEGERRFRNVVAAVERARGNLPAGVSNDLIWLADSMNRPDVTRAKRFQMMNETLDKIFPDNPGARDIWKSEFGFLASIGNDKAYKKPKNKRKSKERDNFEEKKKRAKKAKTTTRRRKRKPAAVDPSKAKPKTKVAPATQKMKADKALKLLEDNRKADEPDTASAETVYTKPEQLEFSLEPPSDADAARDAEEPQVPKEPKKKSKTPPKEPKWTDERKPAEPSGKTGGGKSLSDQVADRVEQIRYAIVLAEAEGDDLNEYIQNYLGKSSRDRVEKIFYDIASDRMTMDMVVDRFATEYDIDPVHAAKVVDAALFQMEQEGQIKRYRPTGQGGGAMIHDSKLARDKDGNFLSVVRIEPIDQFLVERLEVAKAVQQVSKMAPQDDSHDPFTPRHIKDGDFRAIKGVPSERIDEAFMPLLNTVNRMRDMRHMVNQKIMSQIKAALPGSGNRRVGTIGDQIKPKVRGQKRRDQGPLYALSHLIFQTDESDGTIRQEWFAGENGRIYSRNGPAHTQSGDLMKGILRAESPAPVGGESGLNYLLHGIGNLLGFDKEAPKDRRDAMFDNDMVDDLVKFAEDPFGRLTMKDRNGKATPISEMVKDGEGFFQVLNAAHEVSDMVAFARARHKDKAEMSNADLLQDPDVRADLSQNYQTDFIVQLDASNNAYQIAGMAMGYRDVLAATGLIPRDVEDPDTVKGADIYLEPAVSITERIPELLSLGLPLQKLRKLFKGPIGTYLYAAEFSSRQESFQDTLEEIADGADVFGIDGDGLIPVPEAAVQSMLSEEGFEFEIDRYNVEGEVKSSETVRKRIKEGVHTKGKNKGKPAFYVSTAKGKKGKFKDSKKAFDTAEEAIKYVYGMDVYTRMNRELVREMNVRYPGMRRYLDFADKVAKIARARGLESIKVPTKDGIMLEYNFKQNPVFDSMDIETADGKKIKAGIRTNDYKLAGRGLAAFMTHQNDAWALRETMRRMPNLHTFNPIHDSFGFHPSDAEAGQKVWTEVMHDIGNGDYNLFLEILSANGINPDEFVEAGGDYQFILERQHVEPVDHKSIPTALS